MRIRRILLLALCMALLPICALAGQLLSPAGSVPGALPPVGVSSQTSAFALSSVTDDLAATWWQRSTTVSPAGADLQLTPAEPTLAAIWLRSGNCSSQSSYQSYAHPAVMRVTIHYAQGGSAYQAEYRYALTDAYRPDAQELMWQSGYQCLALPAVYEGVTRVDLTVESWAGGTVHAHQGCITDVLLSSVSPSLPASTPAPTRTPVPQVQAGGVQAKLLMRMATRSGPSTDFDELGSYYKAGHEVTALSITYDENDVPWVQVEFTYQGSLRRAYTGLKRVDVNPALLRTETALGEGVLIKQTTPRYGPGKQYAPRKFNVRKDTTGTVYAIEDGWAQFEFYAKADGCFYRVWVPESSVGYKK